MECSNEHGELPYLDLLIIDNHQQLSMRWFRKGISSERSVNYFSNVPQYEFINTFVMRFVVASVHDSGGYFLHSYWVILREVWCNSIPKRFLQSILYKATRYFLGRRTDHKVYWLELLANNIYSIDISIGSYELFVGALSVLAKKLGLSRSIFHFENERVPIMSPSRDKKVFWSPGDPIHVFTYRGEQSMRLYDTVKATYPGFPISIRHNVGFSNRSIMQGIGQ